MRSMIRCTGRYIGRKPWWVKALLLAVVLYLIAAVILGMLWSRSPEAFSVQNNAQAIAAERGQKEVPGYVTTTTVIRLAQTLLDKPGGFLSNDRFPPGLWLDNMPNWEYGVLIQIRDLTRAMRKDFSRSQSQSSEDPNLAKAEPNFNYGVNSWIFPSSESEYQKGINQLNQYLNRLANPKIAQAQFYTRADSLATWLGDVSTRLGSLSQRLTASVGQVRDNTDLAGDANAQQSTHTQAVQLVKTPWSKIDDVFYETRGYDWALLEVLKAIDIDFAPVLRKKNAQASLRQIIRELEGTQNTIWSPMILNGSGFGLFANHSLVMASYNSRANAAIIDLRHLLAEG